MLPKIDGGNKIDPIHHLMMPTPTGPPTIHQRHLSSGFIHDNCRQPDDPLIGKEVGTYPNDKDEDGDADSGVSDDLMIGETKEVPEERLSKADEIDNKELDDRSFCGGLNCEGLDKQL